MLLKYNIFQGFYYIKIALLSSWHFWVLRINYKCYLTLVTWGLVFYYPFVGGGFCAFNFGITFFPPLLLNAHVATYLYCISKALLNKCAWDLCWKGGKFIFLNSCSSSVSMKLGFLCVHTLWPPSPTHLSLKRHKCLTAGEAVGSCTSPRKSLREEPGFTSLGPSFSLWRIVRMCYIAP